MITTDLPATKMQLRLITIIIEVLANIISITLQISSSHRQPRSITEVEALVLITIVNVAATTITTQPQLPQPCKRIEVTTIGLEQEVTMAPEAVVLTIAIRRSKIRTSIIIRIQLTLTETSDTLIIISLMEANSTEKTLVVRSTKADTTIIATLNTVHRLEAISVVSLQEQVPQLRTQIISSRITEATSSNRTKNLLRQ